MLPVCQECRAHGALPIVRSRRRNGAHIDKRAQRRRIIATASQVRDDVDTVAVTYAIGEDAVPPITAATTTHLLRRGRKPREPNSGIVAPRNRKTRRPDTRRGLDAD